MISKRLKFIATFVDKNMIIGDIGSDHGYLPLFLFENNIIIKAYACDNKKGPYQNLLSTFKDLPYDIEIKLNDGINNLPSYVNTIILTGMGGDLIISILQDNLDRLKNVEYMILSPQQNIYGVRKFISSIGYQIIDEGIIEDDKFYNVIKCKKGNSSYSELELEYGPVLLKTKNLVLKKVLQNKINDLTKILTLNNLSNNRIEEINQQLARIKEVIKNEF